ncbi:hypothetical protein LCGC14_2019180 [marine sediment metagenome]|uniref:Uncharacterized protein n=1 Tax=marine sediment metagenome TaxID=412755 RepID=A0A0F9HV44_9ZZZZ
MKYVITAARDYEEIIVEELKKYFFNEVRFKDIYPNFKNVRISGVHPFVYLIDAEVNDTPLPQGLFPSITIISDNEIDTNCNPILVERLTGETTITVGTNTKADYTKFFPSTGTLRIDSEEITYSAKSVTTFTVDTRAQNGTSAAAHTAGALITLRNVSTQIGFGAEIAVRGWGMKPTPITQKEDYGFENGIGIKAIFGQIAVKDTSGNEKNYLLMKSYASNPGII